MSEIVVRMASDEFWPMLTEAPDDFGGTLVTLDGGLWRRYLAARAAFLAVHAEVEERFDAARAAEHERHVAAQAVAADLGEPFDVVLTFAAGRVLVTGTIRRGTPRIEAVVSHCLGKPARLMRGDAALCEVPPGGSWSTREPMMEFLDPTRACVVAVGDERQSIYPKETT